MQTVSTGVSNVINKTIAATTGERVYGEGRETDHFGSLRRMPVPAEMHRLRDTIERQSRLLSLAENSGPKEIYNAFGSDLELLIRYRDAFKSTIDAAVRARAAADDTAAQAFLDPMTRQIAEVVFEPTLDLGPTAVALPADALRCALQDQFRADAVALALQLHF